MHPTVGVKIENKHLAELITLRKKTKGLLKLTTLKPGQRKASIKVFLLHNRKKKLITEFRLSHLDRAGSKTPAIDIEAEYNGRFRLILTLMLNGKVQETREFSLYRFLPQRLILRWILPPLIVVGLLLLLLLLFFPRWKKPVMEDNVPPAPVPTQEKPATQPTTTQSPTGRNEASTTTEQKPLQQADKPVVSTGEDVSQSREEAPPPPRQTAMTRLEEVTVYFNPDEAALTAEAREVLLKALKILNEYQGEVSISGHCASFGTESGRMDLSRQRARAVYSFLQDQGWKPKTEPAVHGYGSTMPAEEGPEKQHLNRRVEIASE